MSYIAKEGKCVPTKCKHKGALLAQDQNFLAVIKLREKEPPGETGNISSLKSILADEEDHLARTANLLLRDAERD